MNSMRYSKKDEKKSEKSSSKVRKRFLNLPHERQELWFQNLYVLVVVSVLICLSKNSWSSPMKKLPSGVKGMVFLFSHVCMVFLRITRWRSSNRFSLRSQSLDISRHEIPCLQSQSLTPRVLEMTEQNPNPSNLDISASSSTRFLPMRSTSILVSFSRRWRKRHTPIPSIDISDWHWSIIHILLRQFVVILTCRYIASSRKNSEVH